MDTSFEIGFRAAVIRSRSRRGVLGSDGLPVRSSKGETLIFFSRQKRFSYDVV